MKMITRKYDFTLDTPVKAIPKPAMEEILNGSREELIVTTTYMDYEVTFSGLVKRYRDILDDKDSIYSKEDIINLIPVVKCSECNGTRLKKESLYFKIDNRNISEVANMQLDQFYDWISGLSDKLKGNKALIAEELIKEIKVRTKFILDVGL